MKKAMEQGMRVGDGWLLAIFAVLIVQSIFGLFYPLPAAEQVESVDIVFRTSEAAIFGYIISGNFGRKRIKTQQRTSVQGETVAPIGFETLPADVPTATATPVGKRTEPTVGVVKEKKRRFGYKNTQQLTLVGIIGLISLLVLLVWRNIYGTTGGATTGMIAVIAQYRDMVSGCVGFLIGHPQSQSEDDG